MSNPHPPQHPPSYPSAWHGVALASATDTVRPGQLPPPAYPPNGYPLSSYPSDPPPLDGPAPRGGGYSGQYFSPAQNEPPEPPRQGASLRTVLVVAAVFAVGLMAVGAVAVAGSSLVVPASASKVNPAGEAKTLDNVPGADHSGDIRSLLLPVPAGGQQFKEGRCASDQFTLADGTSRMDNPATKRLLQLYRFRQGVQRCWRESDQGVVVVLLRFDGEQEAAKFVAQGVKELPDANSATPDTVGVVPGVPGGAVFSDAAPKPNGAAGATAIGQRGDIAFLISGAATSAAPTTRVSRLAREQFNLL